MNKLKLIIKCGLAVLLMSLYSCESWLDVKPTDRLSEDMLFADREGFVKALNGVYIELNTTQLYGMDLTAGALDVMGQYYDVSTSSHAFNQYGQLLYTEKEVKNLFDNMWQKCYLVIASCNAIIEKCDENKAQLSPVWIGAIKGEALALRAMLHFDMLRLFGPIPSELDKESIPYQTGSKQTETPLLSGNKVLELILEDLASARDLLKDTDPYFLWEDSDYYSANDINYRNFRMNYFAVKGLMARVYLWGGDKQKAGSIAKEVIEEGSGYFPFITNGVATASQPDRIFYPEVLFGTYNSSREKLQEDLFSPTLESTKILALAGAARREELYDDKNDYRYQVWASHNKGGSNVFYPRKYEKFENNTSRHQYMIALIRMSEMYLIAAECCDLSEALEYLNTYRNARNCFSIYPTEETMISTLANEYKKEMLGEGQLFFFYKRQEMVNIPDGNKATGTKNVELSKYVIPLPDSETSQRVSNTDK